MLVKATALITMPAGVVLGLTPQQFDARRLTMIETENGYQTTAPTLFKPGEVFDFISEPPKSLPDAIYEILEPSEPPKKAKKSNGDG